MSLLLLLTNAQAAALLTAWLTDDGNQHIWITSFPWSASAIETQGEFVPVITAAPAVPSAALWQEQPQAWDWTARYPVTDDETDGPLALVNAYSGFPLAEDPQWWNDSTPWSSRIDDDDDDGFPPLPNAYTGYDLAYYDQRWQDATPWYTHTDHSVEPVPQAPDAYDGFAIGVGGDERSNQPSWFQPDTEAWYPAAPAAAVFDPSGGFPWQEQPQDWFPLTWFQPDTESFYPFPEGPGVAPFNPALGFDWSEQPQAWQDATPWSSRVDDDDDDGFVPQPSAYAGAELADPNIPLWRDGSPWFRPDDAFEGLLPIAAAFDPSGFAALWYEQPGQERALEARWFTNDDAFESPRPLPNAWAGADIGYDPSRDQPNQPQWPTFDIGEGFPPKPNAYAGADIGWDAVADRNVQPVWPTVDSGSEWLYLVGIVPVTIGGKGPTGYALSPTVGGRADSPDASGMGYNSQGSGKGAAPAPSGNGQSPSPRGES